MAYWKKLKNTDAVPVLKDELVFDTTPTVNSTNPVTSDGVARAIAGASGEVPVVTENDNGKVLSAVYDADGAAVEWAEVPSEVPEYSAVEEGKVLGVVVDDSGDTPIASLDWVEQPADELPSISGNAGKVLKVNSGATGVEWGEVPQELPASLGTAGQVLTVNSGATGVEWATPSGGSGGVVMLDYTETDSNLFNAAVAGITNGQPVFVTRSPGQTATYPAIPLVQKLVDVNGNVTVTELCFTCTTATHVTGFTLTRTTTYDPEVPKTTHRFSRTTIWKELQFST